MCCICYARFSEVDLERDIDGSLTNICKKCADDERKAATYSKRTT